MSISNSQFRSVIKSRESIKNLTNPNLVKTQNESTKNNFGNNKEVKNMGFDVNNPNYNSDVKSDTNEEKKKLDPGFGPVVGIVSGKYKLYGADMINHNDFTQIDNILNIKPEVFNYNQKFTKKEIEKIVQSYKGRLNAELLKILNEEKNKEEERELKYTNTLDSIEKKRLEKMISLERNQSSAKILKINE